MGKNKGQQKQANANGKGNGAVLDKNSSVGGEIREGKARVLLTDKNDVFYNKAQVVNRDISIAVIKTFIERRKEELRNKEKHMKVRWARMKKLQPKTPKPEPAQEPEPEPEPEAEAEAGADGAPAKKKKGPAPREREAPKVHILEAMAASGLRALRYALEIPDVGKVFANDMDEKALAAMRKNIAHNGVEDKVEPTLSDARILMLQKPDEFDVVDLDPYGSPTTLLDSAVQSVCDGGLLCVTATDMAVLCGNNSETCWMKYGSYPLKGKFCHESALRILLHSIQSHAARYKKHIVPVLSMSVDFYVRVFVRVYTSAGMAKEGATRVSYAFQCCGCGNFHFQPVGRAEEDRKKFHASHGPVVGKECDNCGKRFKMGGPMWTEPIHDKTWIRDMLKMMDKGGKEEFAIFDKVKGLLTVIDEELEDAPLSICLHEVTRTLKCCPPPHDDIRSAIANAGFKVSSTHDTPTAIKTNAPWPVFWDIMKGWVKDHPLAHDPQEGSPAQAILSKPPAIQAKFARVFSALSKGKMNKVARFTPNPESHWGPGTRAGRKKRPAAAQHFFKDGSNKAKKVEADETAGGAAKDQPQQPQ